MTAEKIVKVALGEVGCKGIEYCEWYYGSSYITEWCAVFVSWCANEIGALNKIIYKSDGAGTIPRESVPRGWGKWYEPKNKDGSYFKPKKGDIILFNPIGASGDKYFSSHIGIVTNYKNSKVYTVEGNTRNSNDSLSIVTENTYAYNHITINGYYRPNYENSKTEPEKIETPTSNTTGKTSIKEVQRWLNAEYGTKCTIDGVYGSQTQSAIIGSLQCYLNTAYNAKLRVDGIWGTLTKAQIRNVKKGATGNYVKILQSVLICKGRNTNGYDGIYGSQTEQSVKDFQAVNKIIVDGIAGKSTFEKLLK